MKKKILFIDDEKNLTDTVVKFLGREFQCKGAYSLKEAIEKLKEEDFDLVITDVRLGDGSGMDVLEYLKENKSNTKAMVLTAYGSPTLKYTSLKEGAIVYMEKPVDLSTLMINVKKVITELPPIKNISLIDLLKFSITSKQNITINVSGDGLKGEIGIKNGVIVWANTEEKEGMDALFDILSLNESNLKIEGYKDGKGLINIDIDKLLLQLSKRNEKKENVIEEINKKIGDLLKKFVDENKGVVLSKVVQVSPVETLFEPLKEEKDLNIRLVKEIFEKSGELSNLFGNLEVKDVIITTNELDFIIKGIDRFFFWIVVLSKEANVGFVKVVMDEYIKSIKSILENIKNE